MKRIPEHLLAQLKKPTAWRGIILFLTSVVGIVISPEQANVITSAGIGIAGLIGWLAPPDPE